VNGIVLDAGGLIARERNDRRASLLLDVAVEDGIHIIIPATALAQVFRNPARQARLLRLLGAEETEVVPLDEAAARNVGELLAHSSPSDITDAHVVICAQHSDYTVITRDPSDTERLDPALAVIPV